MAKKSNIDLYERAKAGQRVFSVANANADAVKMGLYRMGYKVTMQRRQEQTTITIQEK